MQHSSPPIPQQAEFNQNDTEGGEDVHLQPGTRTPTRGGTGGGSSTILETVQEVSPLASPQAATENMMERLALDDSGVSEAGSHIDLLELSAHTIRESKPPATNESGSESGSIKGDRRRPSISIPPTLATRQSSASVKTNAPKSKPSEGSAQHMTVETEIVTSIPQVSLAPVPTKEGGNSTLRTKPSSETIRPKKEKRKLSRKHPSVNTGTGETQYLSSSAYAPRLRHHQSMRSVSSTTDALISPTRLCAPSTLDEATSPRRSSTPNIRSSYLGAGLLTKTRAASSKADIFEAKIASAVDEADTSDSEETFVYDSNPPDTSDRPRRYHSRTPSATSMVSQVDRNGLRSISSIMENAGPSGVKRNMKFVNTFNSSGNDSGMAEEEGKGTVRTVPGSGRGTSRVHHHHFGRWGRNSTNNGHTSLFDNEAPFHVGALNTQRSKLATNNSRQSSSGPPSPRFLNAGRLAATGKRGIPSASYDLDETTGADDERTPLIPGSVRSNRSARSRRQPVSMRALEGQNYHRYPSMLNRFASCLVLTVMLLLVVSGAIGFMFATSQPLTDVELVSINTVIASETELMFDLSVKAHNPNVVVVVVDQADIEVFAKSPHAGTDSEWRLPKDGQNPDGTWNDGKPLHSGGLEEPVDDKAPNMRLGSISHLDSPLSFEGSFFNQGVSASTGEVRLLKPGNGTHGGTERWEKILQDEFDLIIKGVLKYSLPLSQRVRSVTISGRTTVKPNSANDPTLKPNETAPITKG